MSRKAIFFVLLSLGVFACDKPDSAKASPTPSASHAAEAPSSRTLAQSSASAAPSGSAAPQTAGASWSGDYVAKKSTIELPKKINDETWKKDPGDSAVGPGKLTLSVNAGTVTGTASGALGDQIAAGTFDGKSLHVALNPKDPTAPSAMTGTAVGDLSDGVIKGILRCSGPDAVVVREAPFEIRLAK